MDPLPAIPLYLFLVIPLVFVFLVYFTNVRYQLHPNNYIGSIAVFASLVVGFIFLYGMQKYDRMDANVPVVERNILFLCQISLKYNPDSLCLLAQYIVNFLDFTNDEFPIIQYEFDVLPLIKDETEQFRVREAVTILELINNERITRTNLITNAIWYVVLVSIVILTIIFPLDQKFCNEMDSTLVIILIWFPIYVIYYLYNLELDRLDDTMKSLLRDLKRLIRKEGVKCTNDLSMPC